MLQSEPRELGRNAIKVLWRRQLDYNGRPINRFVVVCFSKTADIDLEKVKLLQCVRILHVDYTAQVGKLACSAAVTVLDLGVV